MCTREPVTLFSFGYWGWGNATAELVKAVDAVEASRGFGPPVFVDIRISRSVRAKGFSGGAFAETVGPGRYVWMPGLGNEAIRKRSGPPIQIRSPEEASDLLKLARDKESGESRRVIFFCSCEWPKTTDGCCHRMTVGSLLIGCARSRSVSLVIIEWPGGGPTTLRVNVSAAEFRKSRRAVAIPLGTPLPEPDRLGLPWASIAEVHAEAACARYFVGPARFRGGQWVLPKLTDEFGGELSAADGLELGAAWRKRWLFDAQTNLDTSLPVS